MAKYLLFIIIYCSVLSAWSQPPVNDNCISALPLAISSTCQTTIETLSLSTQSLPPITCGAGTSSLAKDVWFSFLASSPNATIIATPNQQLPNNFNLVMGLYNACGGSLITCADQYGNLQSETIQASGLTIGNTYFINIYQYKNSISSPDPTNPTFSICVIGDNPTNVNNNVDDYFLLGPNPTETSIHLNDVFVNQTHSILIYDATGKTVFYSEQVSDTIDLSSLQKGEYNMLFIQKNGGYNPKERIIYRKIIKQ